MTSWKTSLKELFLKAFESLVKADDFEEIRTKTYPSSLFEYEKEALIAQRTGKNSYQLNITVKRPENSGWEYASVAPNIMPGDISKSITGTNEQNPVSLSEALAILERFEENHPADPLEDIYLGSIHYSEIKKLQENKTFERIPLPQ